MLSKLDDWLLDVIFEPLSHKIQMNYGILCFSVARMFCIVELIVLVASSAWFVLVATEPDFFKVIVILMAAMGGKMISSSLEVCVNLLKKCDNLSDNSKMNSLRLHYKVVRLIFWFSSVTSWMLIPQFCNAASIGWSVILSLDLVALYFLSCTPLPPQKSKALALVTNAT